MTTKSTTGTVIETAAQNLYNYGTTRYHNPEEPHKLDLLKLVGRLGGEVYHRTQLVDLDPNTPTIEKHGDGTFTLTVIYSSPAEVYYPPQDKLFNHRLACLLGTYITHHTDKPAGIHETHNERRYKRRTPQALDGLKFARCLMIPRHQLLAEWERTWRTENFWKFNLADAFGIDVMWLEVRARELNLLHPSGKSFRTPTPVPIET